MEVMDNFGTDGGYLNDNNPPLRNYTSTINPVDCEKLIDSVVPDSVCMTHNGGLSSTPRNYPDKKETHVAKKRWTDSEDRMLRELVEKYGSKRWSNIAQMLRTRNPKQCRERWCNHVRPNIKKDAWSEVEDWELVEAYTKMGNKWAEIAKRLPGRSENSIKNRWNNAANRRQRFNRKCRSEEQKGTILENYIKILYSFQDCISPLPCSPPVVNADDKINSELEVASEMGNPPVVNHEVKKYLDWVESELLNMS